MKQLQLFTIQERKEFGERSFSLTLQHPGKMQPIAPGQFVEVDVPGAKDVYLRRPISIHDVDSEANTVTLLIQRVGKGTDRLHQMKVGESLSLIYPLGKGFSVVSAPAVPVLVGGGIGIAPLLYLAKCYAKQGVRPVVLLGGRTEALIPTREEFAPYGDMLYATEDGSLGFKGLVTQHPQFLQMLQEGKVGMIQTCGPTPMMKAVARLAAQNKVNCEVSLENTMACGIGACLCCVCDTDEGHLCVCKEGPVFNISKLTRWMES